MENTYYSKEDIKKECRLALKAAKEKHRLARLPRLRDYGLRVSRDRVTLTVRMATDTLEANNIVWNIAL